MAFPWGRFIYVIAVGSLVGVQGRIDRASNPVAKVFWTVILIIFCQWLSIFVGQVSFLIEPLPFFRTYRAHLFIHSCIPPQVNITQD